MRRTLIIAFLLGALVVAAAVQNMSSLTYHQKYQLSDILTGPNWRSNDSVAVMSVSQLIGSIDVTFSEAATTTLVTGEKLDQMTDSVQQWLGTDASVVFKTEKTKTDLRTLAPQTIALARHEGRPLVVRLHDNESNLYGRSIALWNSHGYYYDQKYDRWEWQRARLFGTVEDLLTSSFVLQFLTPMLENAGANVLLPRERDQQTRMYVADDADGASFASTLAPKAQTKGFAPSVTIKDTTNPFVQGTARAYELTPDDSLTFRMTSVENGEYAVYVAYEQNAQNTDSAMYEVHHAQGTTRYCVNQQRGGGMWVYLGSHTFDGNAAVVVKGSGRVSADAVRIGGGMGTVERGGETSCKPSWMECARYYLQANGFGSEVYTLSGMQNDYNDDINCRGEWVNALKTQKNIEADIALAFHTDAYYAGLDTTIGTLTIVRTNGTYVNGQSKRVARDVAQCIEEQIASDVRKTWNPTWTTRGIWDKNYSEARRADCPTVLLELLSHQNLNDVRFAQHPQFRFDVCRAIYKALLRALEGRDAVVQPLPVSHFGIERIGRDSLLLSWRPTTDPLEPTAQPTRYAVMADGMEVMMTDKTSVRLMQDANGMAVEYTIVAMNDGGRAFPSQSLCAVLTSSDATMLYVDGFDRLSAPAIVKTPTYVGIDDKTDPGCAWGKELYHTGRQYDYDPMSQWVDDDCPGLGASYADEEGIAVMGSHLTKRDTVVSLSRQGVSVVSQQKSYFESGADKHSYDSYHIALGAQRTAWYGAMPERHAIYTSDFMKRMTAICKSGASVTVCGAYVGTEMKTAEQLKFGAEVLGIKPMTNNASRIRTVIEKGRKWVLPVGTQYGQPDAIEPARPQARTIQRYADSKTSAATEYGKVRVYAY